MKKSDYIYLAVLFFISCFVSCSLQAQRLSGTTTEIKVNTIYNLDNNPYSKNPFEDKDVQIVKVLQIKQGYVQYLIIKNWCCEGKKFSQALDVFTDQVNSYKRKYK